MHFIALPVEELRGVYVDDGHPEASVLPRLVPHASLFQLLPDHVHLEKIQLVNYM